MVPTDRHVHTNTHSRQETDSSQDEYGHARRRQEDCGKQIHTRRHQDMSGRPGELSGTGENTHDCTHEVHYSERAQNCLRINLHVYGSDSRACTADYYIHVHVYNTRSLGVLYCIRVLQQKFILSMHVRTPTRAGV